MAQQVTQQALNVALLSTFDIVKPVKRNLLYQRYGVDQGLYDLLDTLGYDREVDNEEISHFEQTWFHDTFKVKSTVADAGAGNDLTITLDPDSLDSNNNFYPQLYDNVLMPSGNNNRGQITDVDTTTPSAPTITITPLNSSKTLGGVSADDLLVIYSNQWGERTTQPDNIVTDDDEYKFYAKIIKGQASTSGTAAVTGLWYDTFNQSGESIPTKMRQTEIEEDKRMKMRIEGSMWFDEKTTNSSASGKSMWGLFDWVENGGNVSEITPGQFSMVDFDIMENVLDQEQAPNELFGCLGTRLYQDVENTLGDYFSNGAVVYANFKNPQTAQDLNLDFSSLKKSGRTYHFYKMSYFNHQKIGGANGYNYGSWGMFMPVNMRMSKKSNGKMPAISKFYLSKNGYSRKMEVWPTGAAGGFQPYTNETDEHNVNYRAHVGIEAFASNQWYLIKAKSS